MARLSGMGVGLAGVLLAATGAYGQEAATAETAVSVPATVNLTNAGGVMAAINAGDVDKVMVLGGSARDVVEAMRAKLAKDPNAVLDPNAPRSVPLSRWLASMDEHLARGEQPVFIQENGRTRLAFFDPDGKFLAVTVVPGMNAPGREPVGMAFHVPTPDEITAQAADAREAAMPTTVAAAIAAGNPQAVSRNGGTMADYNAAMRAQAVARGDQRRVEMIDRLPASAAGQPAPPYRPQPRSMAEMNAQMEQMNREMAAQRADLRARALALGDTAAVQRLDALPPLPSPPPPPR